jgi:predicted AAA+ superfamily ATPase
MIPRQMQPKLLQLASKFPVVALLGPRQSGKTTLLKESFSDYPYVSLEDLDMREFAQSDPRGFLETYRPDGKLILDEVQRVPSLFSYIQTEVDRKKNPGGFILSGSHNFLLSQQLSQTLAGRIAILTLLPLTMAELNKANKLPNEVEELLFQGLYPLVHSMSIPAVDWYPNYIRTFVERDVRLITNIGDLNSFQRFLKLCAGRIGQLVNVTSLASDCGISQMTARSWLSILEASYVIFLLQPHFQNFSKRLVKSPKMFFYDTGVACALLGIESAIQIKTHYLRGGLFESFVISEFLKIRLNEGLSPNCYFWRDKAGHEVDCIIEKGNELIPLEIKAGKTIASDYFNELNYWSNLAEKDPARGIVVYAGNENQKRKMGQVVSWQNIDKIE